MWKLFSFLKMFREDLLVMMAAVKDPRTPVAIDDAAVLPAAVFGLIRFLPPHVRADAQAKAERLGRRLPYIVALASLALIAWIALIVWGVAAIFR